MANRALGEPVTGEFVFFWRKGMVEAKRGGMEVKEDKVDKKDKGKGVEGKEDEVEAVFGPEDGKQGRQTEDEGV